mmetsp:Transcript_8186/g.25617  ORF Transcript_8186/g.25617 Transcript_8186/m.25617 type:complete len:87 (-) Transcript_8186:3924-4184(-)
MLNHPHDEATAYASAIFWARRDGESTNWCKLEGSTWTSVRPSTDGVKLCTAPPRKQLWRPWTHVVDSSNHPRTSWVLRILLLQPNS